MLPGYPTRNLPRKVRETRSSGSHQGHQASRPLWSQPPGMPRLPSRDHRGSRRSTNQVLPATGRVHDAHFRAIRRRLTHGRAKYQCVPVLPDSSRSTRCNPASFRESKARENQGRRRAPLMSPGCQMSGDTNSDPLRPVLIPTPIMHLSERPPSVSAFPRTAKSAVAVVNRTV